MTRKRKTKSASESHANSEASTPVLQRKKPGTPAEEAPKLLVDQPATAKWKNWWTRTFWTVVMILGFLGILYAGPQYVILLVGIIQIIVYKEVLSLSVGPSKEKSLPWFRSLHWYFLASTNYFLYGESLIYYYKPYVLVDAFLMPLATHHRFISFSLYTGGLVIFVLNLKKGFYKFQFAHFCWTHMALLLVVAQSHFIINNIFEGLIWFVLPCALVVCNDIMAYVSGFFLGKTPLIKISPKKTWEGFIGGLIVTVELFLIPGLLRWIVMPFHFLFPTLVSAEPIRTMSVLPIQFHALVFAMFASLIAPFGGFFASGVKRAFNIKDFADSIPGHGGLTDRMDCQFIMGVFASLYYHSFIGRVGMTVGTVLELALQSLDTQNLVQLYIGLGKYLEGQGIEF
ncbi:hypothetical protein HK103_006674 [Boothiomyces macroporosus]|uniref:Phosphatidate cytidylyltransferase n=1 Tax=Boothiomyces macroporosus TaxID=261099 RepID=A0AAD5UA50_9FUNG|nr:hypothetical protein HK103_001645 [Boothiomyces macroporosus]KAJ3255054.1 hypothetical protein HK103_006674 [Boothiomyces macroporosus]